MPGPNSLDVSLGADTNTLFQDRVGRLESRFDQLDDAFRSFSAEHKEFRVQMTEALTRVLNGQQANSVSTEEKVSLRLEKAISQQAQIVTKEISDLRESVAANRSGLEGVRTLQLTAGKVNYGLIISAAGTLLVFVSTIVAAGVWSVTAINDKQISPLKGLVESFTTDLKTTKERAFSAVTHDEHDVLRASIDRKADFTATDAMRQDVNFLKSRDSIIAGENSKSLQDRIDMAARINKQDDKETMEITALTKDVQVSKGERLAYQERNEANLSEVETQFKDITHLINIDRMNRDRFTSMLWEKTFGSRFPNDTQYYPDLYRNQNSPAGGSVQSGNP